MDAPNPRLFVAVPAPAGVQEAAEGAIARLRGAGDVRWVAPERLHLTLKFLGETPVAKVAEIAAALEKTANIVSRFVVDLGGAGAFPSVRKPQTVWLGLAGGAESLVRLAGEVDRGLLALGFPAEVRPFRPHLTLGRVKSGRRLYDLTLRLQAEQERRAPGVEWAVEEVLLVQSVLRPAGSEYTELRRFPLSGEEQPARAS